MRSKSVPTHEGVVAELMRRQLGISTATANESARRLPQVARFSLSVSRFAGWKRTQGALSKEIVVPFRSSLLRPIRDKQSARIKTGNRTGKGRQNVAAGGAQPAFGPVGAATQRDGPSDLLAIEA